MVALDAVNEEDIDKLIIPDYQSLPADESTFKAYIEAKVYDKDGHLIQYHRQSMRSLTQYFLALMSIPIQGTSQNAGANQATGILTSVLGLPSVITSLGSYGGGYYGEANITWSWSIQLGSGTQAFSPSLTSLAAPIANGSGAGQLVYGYASVTYAGTSIYTSITVSNDTSDTINVTEIGLVGTIDVIYDTGFGSYATTSSNLLLSYDTLTTAISIPPNSLATFQVTISFSG